jgi:hypothetical protein
MMKKRFDLKMPDDLYIRLRKTAFSNNQSLAKTVKDILDKELPKYEVVAND